MADDRDIKIYVSKSKETESELKIISDELALHTENGNKEKAIALGHKLARVRPEDGFIDLSELGTGQGREVTTITGLKAVFVRAPTHLLVNSANLSAPVQLVYDPATNLLVADY